MKSVKEIIGIDKAIAYSSGARIVQGIAGAVSVIIISAFLSGVEQGFYFTFGSIVALQVFFELGLTGIITQYVAHEASHLTLNGKAEYEGDDQYKSRLASLIHFCVKWYAVLALLVFLFLLLVGFVYFSNYGSEHDSVSWEIPWILICVGTALKLFQSPFNSIYMGVGKVKEMSEIGFWQQMIVPVSTWLGHAFGFKLYVIGISYLLSVILWQLYIHYSRLDHIVLNLWKDKITYRVNYIKEIFPFQWRIAISWISGYFIFQLFTPVLFATDGAVVAGQMGLTMTVIGAIQSLSLSWINTKVPVFSEKIALKKYLELDKLFNKSMIQMTSITSILFLLLFISLLFLDYFQLTINDSGLLRERFLPFFPLFLMIFSASLNNIVSGWATYLRCHKKEPLLVFSVVCGIACCLSTMIFGNLYGLHGITIGYFAIIFVTTPWVYSIFRKKKKQWHI